VTAAQDGALGRRTLLTGGVAVVVTGGSLSACGDGRPARSQSAPPATGTRLVAAGDVPVGGGLILADHQMVVTQPEAGQFRGFSFVCTHQRCPVTEVKDGLILCHCHGSRFSVATGAPQPGSPAKQPLDTRSVVQQGDDVVAG
jgi:Rieske Fe-S protein